jgi:hypothetical protein
MPMCGPLHEGVCGAGTEWPQAPSGRSPTARQLAPHGRSELTNSTTAEHERGGVEPETG